MIGKGRVDDPRQWVQAAYLVLDAIEDGSPSGLGKLPTQEEIAAEMGVHRATVRHAYRELAELGIVYRVPGLGYFATVRGGRLRGWRRASHRNDRHVALTNAPGRATVYGCLTAQERSGRPT